MDFAPTALGLRGRIRLLSNTAGLAAFLPYQLGRFLVAYPDLSIDLNERTTARPARIATSIHMML